ncbi:MAG: hypothetical protein HYU55_09390 [Nocardioides sp.]|nr:hypothetical protein [Nocardioides sp.]
MIVAVTRSRTVVAALCVVSVLALGACSGDDPQPRFAPPSSSAPTSPSTTAVSGPVEPTMPAAAQGTDAAAAEAFVRFYGEMVNYAQATGDLDGLESMTDQSCTACKGGLAALQRIFARDGRVVGGVNSLSRLRSGHLQGDERLTVWFDLSTTKQLINYPGDRKDEVYRVATAKLMTVLRRDKGQWVIEYWGEDR